MKLVKVRIPSSCIQPELWVSGNPKIGDIVDTIFGVANVIEIIARVSPEARFPPEPPATEEIICAKDLVEGDVLFWNEWCTVNSNWLHPRSPYAKLNITPESEEDRYRLERISGLSIKLNLSQKVRRKTKEAVMSIALIEAIDLAKELERNLMDLSALENAPDRIETVASVYVDKQMLVNTIKTNLKAVQGKLSEQIKKL